MILNRYKNKYATTNKEIALKEIFENIRTHNINQKKADRRGIVYATRSNNGRQHEDIKTFTSLIFIDIDNCSNSQKVKEIFTQITHTVAVWYSTSGNVHALIKIPICKNVDEFKRRYKSLIKVIDPYIKDYGLLDTITSNPTQLAFESYDKEIFIRTNNVVTYNGIEKKKRKKTIKPFLNDPTDSRERWVIDWIRNKILEINTNGYPQLLKYSRALGGYSSGGYIGYDNALATLLTAVNNNEYMNSSNSSGTLKTYLKGAEASFKFGIEEPLKWN
ncbi:MAG: hypothetical protein HOF75_01385 [Flavobacteriaceae bacterium]|jgi:hypothetical protein|nr:hypothetical protein [Flavobacteriaceae bacterium]MBT3919286.1 hypothetical protein [Flavobacteriaceae bacterium]MBT6705050.1 hypothetical protein [Flavobacteriaceae bacterium]MBT7243423.1 hypothetical protein [Flavobacteriaceae bacterium]